MGGNLSIARQLVAKGATVDALDVDGMTAGGWVDGCMGAIVLLLLLLLSCCFFSDFFLLVVPLVFPGCKHEDVIVLFSSAVATYETLFLAYGAPSCFPFSS